MARVKRGTVSRRKHKKLLGLTRGYRGTRSKLIKVAHQAALQAGAYAYQGRKKKKHDFRSLWIVRIGEAAQKEGVSYSAFIGQLKKANVELDRKILADLVLNDPMAFKKILDDTRAN